MKDVIDTALAGWRTRFPGTDFTALELSGRLALAQRLVAAQNSEVLAAYNLELWEWDVLSVLWSADTVELTMGALRAQTFITAGSVTNRVGRLERRGLVERRQDPSSRRRVLVSLTPAGQETVDAVAPSVAQAAQEAATQLAGLHMTRLNQDLAVLTQIMAHHVPSTHP